MRSSQQNSGSSQHAASSLCDEIVTLWRLSALNPALSPIQRDDLCGQIKDWHILTIDKVRKSRGPSVGGANGANIKKADVEVFVGFKPAIEGCYLDWRDYVIPGVTYQDHYSPYWKYSVGRLQDQDRAKASRNLKGGVITSQLLKSADGIVQGGVAIRQHPALRSQEAQRKHAQAVAATDGHCSSSSEGFCDSDRRDSVLRQHDSDSDLGDIDGAIANSKEASPVSREADSEMALPGELVKMENISRPEAKASSSSTGGKPDQGKFREGAGEGEDASGVKRAASGDKANPDAAAANLAHGPEPGNVQLSGDEYQV